MSDKSIGKFSTAELETLIGSAGPSCARLLQQIRSGSAARIGSGAGTMDAAEAVSLYERRAMKVKASGAQNTMDDALRELSSLNPSTRLSVVGYRSATHFFLLFLDEQPSIVACFEIFNPLADVMS